MFYALASRQRRYLLLVASYFFYGWWDWRFCSLVAISTVVDYCCGLGMARWNNPRSRKLLLLASLVTNLGLLGTFKYFNFFVSSFSSALESVGLSVSTSTIEIILPVGISFYTFQTLSYTIDVYRGQAPERNLLDFANFVVFFPQLVAGPIMRAKDLIPQLKAAHEADQEGFSAGAILIIKGLIKKVILADNLAVLVDMVYADPSGYASITCWFATYAYAFQIYLDFSGYTDIAVGTGRLFGIRLMKNFDCPYIATGPSDFWRRWHISLSTWIRDYVFIPLGGSRHGRGRTMLALTLTMALGGLWHGAAWTFVIWGLYHGALLVAERALGLTPRKNVAMAPTVRIVRALVTFHLVCLGWVMFRSPSIEVALGMLSKLVLWQDGLVIGRRFAVIVVFCALLHIASALLPKIHEWRPGPVLQGAVAAIAAYVLIVAAPDTVPFVYFQF